MTAPLFGWYGDDFTGATDTLAVLAQAGLRSILFMGVPSPEALAAAGPLDAMGIAGAARAMPPEAMQTEMSAVGRFFQQVAPPVLHYKVCSTFDSAPHVGNIACGIQTLHPFVDNRWVPIVGGQPSLGRYCAFSNLFAAAGTGGAVHRIDRHPTMRQHPVTPMAEADLRVHLAAQGLSGITALHYPAYQQTPEALDATLHTLLATDAPLQPTLLDLSEGSQLATVGRLLWQQAQQARLLAVGSSAVAQALVAHWARPTQTDSKPLARTTDPVFAWAGSLSPLTAAQVQGAHSYQRIAVDAQRLATDVAYGQATQASILAQLRAGHHVLAYTAPSGGQQVAVGVCAAEGVDSENGPQRGQFLPGLQAHSPAMGQEDGEKWTAAAHLQPTSLLPRRLLASSAAVAQASAALVADVVQAQSRHGTPLRRIGIAGGDTSSHAVQALQLWGLSYQGTLCPGVTLSHAHSPDPARDGLELMLKGGQMGGVDLFERLLGEA